MFLMLALGAPVRSSRRHCFGEFGPLGCEAEPCLLVEGSLTRLAAPPVGNPRPPCDNSLRTAHP